METKTFKVTGMACVHCKARVEKALTEVNGVESATADIQNKTVDVTYEPSVATTELLKQAVEAAGYTLDV